MRVEMTSAAPFTLISKSLRLHFTVCKFYDRIRSYLLSSGLERANFCNSLSIIYMLNFDNLSLMYNELYGLCHEYYIKQFMLIPY